MSAVEPESAPSEAMPAEFGPATATFIIVASMVGTGVLTTSGYTVYSVGSNQLMLGLWILGGIVAACGALTLCELSAALPRTGGDYVFLYEAYGPLVAFLSGWVSFVLGFAAPSALAAFGMAKYLLGPFHLDGETALLAQRSLASLAILGFAVIHISGRKRTAWVQAWITALKLILLVLFVIAGLAVGWPRHAHLADRPPITRSLIYSMTFSLVYISYAYIGWNAASYLAGEVADPRRNLPRAILIGTSGVVALYLGLNVVYALALSVEDIRAIVDSPDNQLGFKLDAVAPIAQLAAKQLFGPGLSRAFSTTIGLMLLSSLSAYVLTGPRVVYAMAKAGQFPAFAGRLTRRAETPAIATALQVSCSLALLWTGSFEGLLIYASVGLAIFSMLAISAIYVLRWRRPDLPRPFRTPGYPVTPAIYLIVTSILTGAAFSQRPEDSKYSLLSILAGIPVYYLWRLGRSGSSTPEAGPVRDLKAETDDTEPGRA